MPKGKDSRRYPVGVDPRRDRRRLQAEERTVARRARTLEEQLVLITQRPGESARERNRIRGTDTN